MRARRFPLATVLRVRRIQEDAARAEVRAAQQTHAAAADEVRSREAMLDVRALPAGVNVPAFTAVLVARLAQASELHAARQRRHGTAEHVGQTVAGWGQARARVRAMEQLEERHREAVAAEDARAEAVEVDEASAAKAARAAREPASEPGSEPGQGDG